MGSTRAARNAGINPAATAASNSTPAAAAYETGSCGAIPYTSELASRAAPIAVASPTATPTPASSKLRRTTGWRPEVPLEEGLQRTIAWYRAHVPALEA